MENIIKEFDNIIFNCDLQINEKLLGINYLENLKYRLIDELKKTKNIVFEDIKDIEIVKEYKNNKLLIKYINNKESITIDNKSSESDCLSILLTGLKTINFHDNENYQDLHSINL